ncbi:hypothetical protein ROHU_010029 [Labeo rohita]|uniref:Uncharacterized protein n=1 Tax=Labeo rohita TaxID=84645 RepID=A0A498LZA5_LABRO|nr:hypothetical protein ROHU_010029 [Labeo rohita]
MGLWRKRAFAVVGKESGKQRYRLLGSSHCCGSEEVEKRFLRERHYCGSVEIQKRLLREKILLRQCGNGGKAPAGAIVATAGWKYRGGSCGSGHYCGSVEIQRTSCGSKHCWGSGEMQKGLLQ